LRGGNVKDEEKKVYTSPTVEELGAVSELTLGSRGDNSHGHEHED